jgi:hypothetical protein
MIPFDTGYIKFELPQDYGELTLKQFFDLRASDGKLITVLSILSGLPKEDWEQCKDIDFEYKIAPYLSFLYEPFNDSNYILPDKLKIDGVYYNRPKNLTFEAWGQKIAFEQEYQRIHLEGKGELDIYPYSLALYFQPTYFQKEGKKKKYKSEEVDKLLPLIMECKIEEAFPIASFFLSNYVKCRKEKKSDYLIPLHQKKYEQALIVSKSSDRLERFTIWRRPWVKITMKFSKWITTRFKQRSGMKENNQPFKGSITR